MDIGKFRETVWEYYRSAGRDLPWRESEADGGLDAYKILVSEVMLQQTQAGRVTLKYHEFLELFPTIRRLADASLADVLKTWNGLGYNRRAKYLHEAAKALAEKPQPWSLDILTSCKGIGPNTAAAVCVYAYDEPLVFIETNIRTVFIHHFFHDKDDIYDKELSPFVEEALDREHPREWYWALMDYGVFLKSTAGNASRASRHYAKQSKFEGSKRQVRGLVLRLVGEAPRTEAELGRLIVDKRLPEVLEDLVRDGLVSRKDNRLQLG